MSGSSYQVDAGRGVDGDDTNYFHTLCFDCWWAVDLGEVDTRVTAVRVVNRKTCGELATQRDWSLPELKLIKQ